MKKLPDELEKAPPYSLEVWDFYCQVCDTSTEEFLGDQTVEEMLRKYQVQYECTEEESVEVLRKVLMAAAEKGFEEVLGKRR